MPIYEYRCTTCEHIEEVFAKMSDPPPAACESCGAATLERVLHPVAVHYKGSGFYSTDYGSSKRKPAAADAGSAASSSDSSSSTSGSDNSSKSGASSSSSESSSGSSRSSDS